MNRYYQRLNSTRRRYHLGIAEAYTVSRKTHRGHDNRRSQEAREMNVSRGEVLKEAIQRRNGERELSRYRILLSMPASLFEREILTARFPCSVRGRVPRTTSHPGTY